VHWQAISVRQFSRWNIIMSQHPYTLSDLENIEKKYKLTPMMQQYIAEKKKFPDAIVLFRLGDFYEMFFEDAKIASQILGITLTSRDKDKGEAAIAMAGIPHHAAAGYISKLCEEGFKVAVCEQTEDPGKKGLFKREISRIITPGMVFDDESLSKQQENRLLGLYYLSTSPDAGFGLASLDVSTGRFSVTQHSDAFLIADEIQRLAPREMIYKPTPVLQHIVDKLKKTRLNVASEQDLQDIEHAVKNLASIEEQLKEGAKQICLLALKQAKLTQIQHIGEPTHYQLQAFLMIDEITRKNLELTHTLIGNHKEGALLHYLNRTQTGMGARRLGHFLLYPLRQKEALLNRYQCVEELLKKHTLRQQLQQLLRALYDLERLNGRIGAGCATPRDLGALRDSLAILPQIKEQLNKHITQIQKPILLAQIEHHLGDFSELYAQLTQALVDTPPIQHKEGGIFKIGYRTDIDELIQLSQSGKDFLLKLEQKEREQTQISTLKIRYNRVFGYGIEVTKSHIHKVPAHYMRRQTLANAERYITEELTSYEEKVLHAEEKRLALEEQVFLALRQSLLIYCDSIKKAAQALAELDVYLSFATLAHEHDLKQPHLVDTPQIVLTEARHPVVESFVQAQQQIYVPFHISLGTPHYVLIITGPNMAGKSTILRAVALIQLMAQMGCFVPAKQAQLYLCDRIYTRVGASDNLSQGQSTFMVEMAETAAILSASTAQSLVIVDEIGRGTSTFDGLSLAWSIAEYLHHHVRSMTLFATHYHELIELENTCPRMQNYHVAVQEQNGRMIFLRTLKKGGTSKSYGIEVAKLAGLPTAVITRAQEILKTLEQDPPQSKEVQTTTPTQLQLFMPIHPQTNQIIQSLKKIDVNQITPMQAMNELALLIKCAQKIT